MPDWLVAVLPLVVLAVFVIVVFARCDDDHEWDGPIDAHHRFVVGLDRARRTPVPGER